MSRAYWTTNAGRAVRGRGPCGRNGAMSLEHVQIAFERWHDAAASGQDLIGAFRSVCSADCVVHRQNGDIGGQADADAQNVQVRAMWPDLAIEIEHVMLAPDRMLIQILLTGTPSLIFRIARGRRVFAAAGAMVAR